LSFSNGTQSSVVAEEDYIGMLGWSMKLGGGLSAGVTARVFRFELAQQAAATGFAGDAGLQWASPLEGLTLGAAIQNAGAELKFEDAADPLPLTARAGAAYAYTWRPDPSIAGTYYTDMRFTATADAEQVRGETAFPAVGAEVAIDIGSGSVALRGGWSFDPQLSSGLTFGAGLREGRFLLSYAQVSTGELGMVEDGSLTVKF
jgi:hypothetical protein